MGLTSSNYDVAVNHIQTGNYIGLKELLKGDTFTSEELTRYCSEPNTNDNYSRTLLHHAVWKEDSQALETLFEFCNNINLESVDYFGMTPLAASINRGNLKGAKYLLEKNASINCDKNDGYFLLRTAVYSNKTNMVELLLKYKCQTRNIKTDIAHGSLLHIACDYGNLNIIKQLIEIGNVPVNITDKYKIQAVHIAASKNYLEVMKYLVDKSADINTEDSLGNVPLGWANFSDSHDIINYLKELNAIEKPFKNLDNVTKMAFRKDLPQNQIVNKIQNTLKDIGLVDVNKFKSAEIELAKIKTKNETPSSTLPISTGIANLSFQDTN